MSSTCRHSHEDSSPITPEGTIIKRCISCGQIRRVNVDNPKDVRVIKLGRLNGDVIVPLSDEDIDHLSTEETDILKKVTQAAATPDPPAATSLTQTYPPKPVSPVKKTEEQETAQTTEDVPPKEKKPANRGRACKKCDAHQVIDDEDVCTSKKCPSRVPKDQRPKHVRQSHPAKTKTKDEIQAESEPKAKEPALQDIVDRAIELLRQEILEDIENRKPVYPAFDSKWPNEVEVAWLENFPKLIEAQTTKDNLKELNMLNKNLLDGWDEMRRASPEEGFSLTEKGKNTLEEKTSNIKEFFQKFFRRGGK